MSTSSVATPGTSVSASTDGTWSVVAAGSATTRRSTDTNLPDATTSNMSPHPTAPPRGAVAFSKHPNLDLSDDAGGDSPDDEGVPVAATVATPSPTLSDLFAELDLLHTQALGLLLIK